MPSELMCPSSIFDNHHVHEYPQAFLVVVKSPGSHQWPEWLLKYTLIGTPSAFYEAPISLGDLVVRTGMTRSRGELRRLLKANGIKAWRWHEAWSDWTSPLPDEEGEYEVQKGQRVLEVITGNAGL